MGSRRLEIPPGTRQGRRRCGARRHPFDAEGRLSAADHARIVRAHAAGRRPPADTPLGGDLGFHGEGLRWQGDSAHLDWTYGCIALADADLDFLAERAPPGTPVRILPHRPGLAEDG